MKKLLFLSLFTFGCAELGIGLTKQQATGGGVVAGITIEKGRQKLKELADFTPYLIVESIELCYKQESGFRCVLALCEGEDNCSREITDDQALTAVDNQEALVVNTAGWVKLINGIQVFCEENPDGCRNKYKSYKNIDRVLIIE